MTVRLRWAAMAMAVGVVATVLAYKAGSAQPIRSGKQAEVSTVDVGFLQDMIVHHEQAVEMALIAMLRSEDMAIRALAGDIFTSQQSQIGMMQGWLRLWDQPLSPMVPPMHWMSGSFAPEPGHPMSAIGGNSTAAVLMPGMATGSEMQSLREASGEDFEIRSLQLLLRHHEGGLPMARFAAAQATVPVVASLAQTIVAAQSAEATALTRMLSEHGTSPLPVE